MCILIFNVIHSLRHHNGCVKFEFSDKSLNKINDINSIFKYRLWNNYYENS